ncbi:stress-induced-phosphoprotein 1-like [Corticium candelabrum]|uniref:stress-induced-phosphoprotein 1-like n=1 Tax=Corticium candelabrum TaxID=121492 RepID=UPI002E26D29B|nr:stress-induced-phosphoprotein 1-like [Corticium candelabrum]
MVHRIAIRATFLPASTGTALTSTGSIARAALHNPELFKIQTVDRCNENYARGYSRKAYALLQLGRHQEVRETCEEGLKVEPTNEQLKEALQEAEQNLRSTGDQSGNPFASPEMWAKLVTDPVTREYLQQDDYKMMLEQLQRNPSAISSMLQDPRIQKTLNVILGIDIMTPEAAASRAKEMHAEEEHSNPQSGSAAAHDGEKQEETKSEEQKTDEIDESVREAVNEKELGNAAYKNREFESALRHYSKAAELDPTNMTYLSNRAAVHFEMLDYDHCIEDCEAAVNVGREQRADFKLIAKALARIGNAHFKQEHLEDAIKYYDKSLAENRADEVRKKRQQVQKIIEEKKIKEYINPEISLQEKEKGNACFQKGDYPMAMKHYHEAIKRNPDDAKLYSNRAACYTKLAEFRLGLEDCEHCIKLDPTFVKGYMRKGAILLALKEPVKAMQAYEKALEIDPENQEAKGGIANCRTSQPMTPEEVKQRAFNDPEIRQIFADPAMQVILRQMEENPGALTDHLKNPHIAQKIQKLVEAGLIQIR